MAKLRTYRKNMNLTNMIKAGNPRYRGIVYGYQFPSRPDIIKIGYSSRGLVRIREQSTGFPETPEVLFSIHHKKAADIEKRIHRDLAAYQVKDVMGTEWFGVSFEKVVSVSPELRRAIGAQRWKSFWRWIIFLLLSFLSVTLLPIIEMTQVMTTGQMTFHGLMVWIREYVGLWFPGGNWRYALSVIVQLGAVSRAVTWACVFALIGASAWISFRWR